MTKCIVIGEQPTQGKKKPIEFVKAMYISPIRIGDCTTFAKGYKTVELIARKCYEGLDVMFAYDNTRMDGCLYLGYWNDGVAE